MTVVCTLTNINARITILMLSLGQKLRTKFLISIGLRKNHAKPSGLCLCHLPSKGRTPSRCRVQYVAMAKFFAAQALVDKHGGPRWMDEANVLC